MSGNSYKSEWSDISDRSDSIQEQKYLQDFAKVCIGNKHYLGFDGQ